MNLSSSIGDLSGDSNEDSKDGRIVVISGHHQPESQTDESRQVESGALTLRRSASRIDLSLDDRAVGDDDPRRIDIAFDRAGRLQVEPLAGHHVSNHGAADQDRSGDQIRLDRGAGAEDQRMIADLNRAFD